MEYSNSESWRDICPVCGRHQDVEMIINQGPHSMFYSCPKYYPENRTRDEQACPNRINLIEYQKMVEKLHGMIAEAECEGGSVDLTNFTWKEKGITYRVLKHERDDKLTVSILNERAFT